MALVEATGESLIEVEAAGDGGAVAVGAGLASITVTATGSGFSTSAEAAAGIDEPMLLPLYYSAEDDVVERELKYMLMSLFEGIVRPGERYVNAMGMPQHGPRELVDASLAADGLSIYRGARDAHDSGAYLLRAWRARNPKRGTHLLKTYLQLFWPNAWEVHQMWQDKSLPYPTELVEADGGNHYLTSRIKVVLSASATTGADVAAIEQGLRSSLPARLIMETVIESEEVAFGAGIANVYWRGIVSQHYEGVMA